MKMDKHTVDDYKRMCQKDESLVGEPFVVVNAAEIEHQGFWIDVFMGLFMIPSITEDKVFTCHQLDGSGCRIRRMRSDEARQDSLAAAMRKHLNPKASQSCG